MGLTPLVAVVGPTASGKTRLAVELALRYGGEVVSADSMQIYKGMDIGTAKPSEQEKRGVPHHLIDLVEPGETFSVADYVTLAKDCIRDIHSRGALPILTGGTGLYVNSLVDNVAFSKTKEDLQLRSRLESLALEKGGQALLDILAEFDPESATRLHPNNVKRIIRAIEVYKTSGVTMTQMQAQSKLAPSEYDLCMIGLYFSERAVLYDRIDRRVDDMMSSGLVEEVRSLMAGSCRMGLTSMQAIGYKEIAGYLEGKTTLEEAVQLVKTGTRHYAKRQMTWFNRDARIHWIDCCKPHYPQSGEEPVRLFENIFHSACDIVDKWTGL